MKVITTEKIPIKMWIDGIEEGAMEQTKNVANLPFAFKHIALMPDCHQGYGVPIGCVLATKNVVIPNAVGVDIGCGMLAVRTSLENIDNEDLKKIMSEIRKKIPVGFNHHKEQQDMPQELTYFCDIKPIIEREYEKARYQIGTLGGGNHFIEIQKGSDGFIWFMIHSGSRNIGKQVADHYNKIAIELNEKWFSQVPKSWQLAFLPLDLEGLKYVEEMKYCVDFAFFNRDLMRTKTMEIFIDLFKNIEFDDPINIAHNYAELENHFGKNVMVHRKGATLARNGVKGIIPGSQGSKSYIVMGKENKDSFHSCSHGAGRKLGRKQAQKTLDLKEEIEKLNNQGIIHSIRSQKDLDEASGAYKNINTVMKNQEDLVSILIELSPLAVIKG